jgi:hypothetical protein
VDKKQQFSNRAACSGVKAPKKGIRWNVLSLRETFHLIPEIIHINSL